ncbi:MAG: MaoC/PaaZ C-terminal domain-containing protein [Micropepsaceae bacterium]
MTIKNAVHVVVGDELPPLTLPALDRSVLALFAGASGDHVPLHIDIDAARKAGMPDVFGHGMLSMAYLGRLVTNWVALSRLRGFDVRFNGITHLANVITCSGTVAEILLRDGERLARVEIRATNQFGQIKTVGDAFVAID